MNYMITTNRFIEEEVIPMGRMKIFNVCEQKEGEFEILNLQA